MASLYRFIRYIPILLVFVVALCLRFINLGYSDYQGDETQAFYLNKNQSLTQFLLDQKKGPIQFIVTASLKRITNNYDNYFLTRFPFALAGFLSSVVFYLFTKEAFGRKTALYSLLFFATNGFFIAFSRIVQYQTLVMLLVLISLYSALLFLKTDKKRFLYTTIISWCVGLLTHSDAMFIAPTLFLFSISWMLKSHTTFKKYCLTFLPSLLIMFMLLFSFYIPLVLHSSDATKNYWFGRFNGQITKGIISSTYLYSIYQPIFGLKIYEILGGIGIFFLLTLLAYKLHLFKKSKVLGTFFEGDTRADTFSILGIFSWFVSALLFMEVLTKFPGTHIWTYILPLCIFMGYGLSKLEKLFPYILRYVYVEVIFILFVFLAYQSYSIFVSHSREYPWEKQKLLVWEIPVPSSQYQLSLFGFPYYRHWKDIRDYINIDGKSPYYSTNEKQSIPRYYLPLEKNSEKAGYFIHIVKPQSFNNVTIVRRGAGWMAKNPPVKVFYNDGKEVARIYLVPENWN